MRNQWVIWAGALSILVVILVVLNWGIIPKNTQVKQKAWEEELLPLTPEYQETDIFSEEVKERPVQAPSVGVGSASLPMESVKATGRLTGRIYTIQACSFKDHNRAQTELKRAQGLGLPTYLEKVDLGKKGVWFRIYVGEFSTKEEIKGLIPRVKNIYKNSFMLVVDKGK
jgi:cell division septation protein DedD